jgi:hypothetical protein
MQVACSTKSLLQEATQDKKKFGSHGLDQDVVCPAAPVPPTPI